MRRFQIAARDNGDHLAATRPTAQRCGHGSTACALRYDMGTCRQRVDRATNLFDRNDQRPIQ